MADNGQKSRFASASLTKGPVRGQIMKLAGFMTLGVVASLVTMLVDVYFIGQLGTDQLAAVTFTFPIVLLITSLAIGLGTGVVSVISRVVGEGDASAVRALGTDSIVLGALITFALTLAGFATIDPLFTLLGASESVLEIIHEYMTIWYLGTLFQIIPQIGNSVIRAHGDARTPSLVMMITAVTNIALDPILIFGWGPVPALGIEGAAWAGNIARAVSLGMLGIVMTRQAHALAPLSFRLDRLTASWRRLLHIALPSTATQLVNPVASAIITGIVARFGTEAVAAFGVATRIEIFSFIFLMGLAIAVGPFVGQNAGAKRMDRAAEGIAFSIRVSVGIGVLLAIALAFGAEEIAARFADDPDVVALIARYMYWVPVSYAFGGVIGVVLSAFNALAMPGPAAVVGLARSILVTVPFVLIGAAVAGMTGVFAAISAATIVVGVSSWVWINWVVRPQPQPELVIQSPAE